MPEPPHRNLEKPDYLGAPAPSTLTPRASRMTERGRTLGRESGRMILLSMLGGALFVLGITVLGHLIRG